MIINIELYLLLFKLSEKSSLIINLLTSLLINELKLIMIKNYYRAYTLLFYIISIY